MKRIPVAFIVDENYLPYLKASIRSLLINAITSPVEVLICHYDIVQSVQDEFVAELARSMELGDHQVRFVSFKSIVDKSGLKTIETKGYLTQCASYRLAIPEVFAEYGRMIYLDSDLLVVGDIADLFRHDLRGNWLGAVRGLGYPDFYNSRPERQKWCSEHGLNDVYTYFNTGVLLYDLKAMREHAPLERLLAAGISSPHFPDQDGLNIACLGHVRLLPEIWNVTVGFASRCQPQLLEDAAILHFATGQKPWNNRNVKLAELWWQYQDAPVGEIRRCGQVPQGTLVVNGWLRGCGDGVKARNWGDDVNYHLLLALAGRRQVVCRNEKDGGTYDVDLLFVGSTLHLATASSIVWGAGMLSERHLPKVQPREIRVVRGPLTHDLLCQAGMECPEVYGDPVWLLPQVYKPMADKRYDICFVTHFVDTGLPHVKACQAAHPEICWVDMGNYGDWHSVIDSICASRMVISSSLHGLIVADAYGVPNVWVELSDRVVGGGFKFHDYFLGVGRRDASPLDFRVAVDLKQAQAEVAKWIPVEFDIGKIMSASPLADEVFSMPLVSVIIPVYNVEEYLDECMASVLGQTYRNLEVICVDDGSTDGSLAKLQDYALKDDRVKVIAQANHGAAVAKNRALDSARGEWVVFMDPDDYYPGKGTINRMLKAAIVNGVDICGGSLQLIDRNGAMLDRSRTGDNFGYFFDQDGIVEYCDYQFDYCYVRFIYRRRLLEEHKLRFPALRRFEDPVFMVKAFIAAGRFYALREVTYVYRAGNSYAKIDWAAEDCFIARQVLTGMKMVIETAEVHGYDNLLARRVWNLIQGAGEIFWREDVQSALGDELYLLIGKYVRKVFGQSRFPPRFRQLIAAKDRRIDDLEARVRKWTHETTVRNQLIAAKDRRIDDLEVRVRKWTHETTVRNQLIAAKDRRIDDLEARVRKWTHETTVRNQLIAAKDKRIDDLEHRVRKWTRETTVRNQLIAAKDKRIDDLEHRVRKWTRETTARNQLIAAKDSRIDDLEARVKLRTKEVVARDQLIVAKDRRIDGYVRQLADLQNSWSYRLGQLLTWPARKVRHLLGWRRTAGDESSGEK